MRARLVLGRGSRDVVDRRHERRAIDRDRRCGCLRKGQQCPPQGSLEAAGSTVPIVGVLTSVLAVARREPWS
jgi:hypothetical protein